MVLLAFRHGLRAAELVDLRWEQVDLENAILHVRRVKQGTPATHPLTGRELRALRRLQREQAFKSPFIFVSERGAPFSKRGFQAMVERAARAASFDIKIHPHMLRHSCGYNITMAPTVVLGCLNQPLDLSLGQVLAGSIRGIGFAHRQSNCAFFGGWSDCFQVSNCPHIPPP
jgi:integrase